MDKLFDLINTITHMPTVSGFEHLSNDKLMCKVIEYVGGFFDTAKILPTGSVLLGHRCGKNNAKKLMFDAHIDTIGFCITEHLEAGFVKVCSVGGVSADILPSCEIEFYGKKTVRGFFTSTPPHLLKGSGDKAKTVDTFCVDTGLTDGSLQELLPIGTPGSFCAPTTKLLDARIASPFLDDKICIAAICECCARLCQSADLNTDIFVLLSAGEEKGQLGARTALSEVNPDACIVLDVNFAKEKGSKESEYIPMDKGPGISVSSCTHRKFTHFIFDVAKSKNIPCSKIVEMTNTGTNAQVLARESLGVATAVVSVPLKYMHSSVECASLDDVIKTSELLCAVAQGFENFDECGQKHFVRGGVCLE